MIMMVIIVMMMMTIMIIITIILYNNNRNVLLLINNIYIISIIIASVIIKINIFIHNLEQLLTCLVNPIQVVLNDGVHGFLSLQPLKLLSTLNSLSFVCKFT